MILHQFLHRNQVESDRVVSLVLWYISLQERQEYVCVSLSGGDPADISDSGGRNGNGSYRASSGARLVGATGV